MGPFLKRVLVSGHHILVRHKDHGVKGGVAALPGVEQAKALQNFAGERCVKARVGTFQQTMQLVEVFRAVLSWVFI